MSTGVGNSIIRALRSNPPTAPLSVEIDAKDIALCVERFWGDQTAEVLTKAAEYAAERAKR